MYVIFFFLYKSVMYLFLYSMLLVQPTVLTTVEKLAEEASNASSTVGQPQLLSTSEDKRAILAAQLLERKRADPAYRYHPPPVVPPPSSRRREPQVACGLWARGLPGPNVFGWCI